MYFFRMNRSDLLLLFFFFIHILYKIYNTDQFEKISSSLIAHEFIVIIGLLNLFKLLEDK